MTALIEAVVLVAWFELVVLVAGLGVVALIHRSTGRGHRRGDTSQQTDREGNPT